jgi:hypothetical protein
LLVPKEALKDISEIRAQMLAMAGPDTAAVRERFKMMDSLRAERRARFVDGMRPAGGMPSSDGIAPRGDGMMARRFQSQGMNGSSNRRFVLLKKDDDYMPRPVEVGVSNYDYAEAVSGLQEGDTVLVFSSSRAGADRQRMMERMRNISGFSGFGGTQSSGQRTGGGR